MAKQNRNILKSYFETGDIPTEGQYSDLIDSFAILDSENTGSLDVKGDIIAERFIGNGSLITGITASLVNVSGLTASLGTGSLLVSGNLYYTSGSSNVLLGIRTTGSILPGGNNIWDLGAPTQYFRKLYVNNIHTTDIYGNSILIHEITASGDIISNENITAHNFTGIFNGALSSSAQIATDISGAFIATSASLASSILTNALSTNITSASVSTRLTTAESELSNTLLSSSDQIATAITGAFTATSASFTITNTTTGNLIGTNIAAISTLNSSGLLSSSNQISTAISGAFTPSSASFSTRLTTAETELAGTLISSSDQIATSISGAFTAPSASISTRLTTAETELAGTLISSSDQIATAITGAFAAPSASISTRLTTAETELAGTLISSSDQIATSISGAFTAPSASISTRLTTAETELAGTLISSSDQIATSISGAFVAPSASISTRLTTAETELAGTLISSSDQIATPISGAFTAPSASFSTRLTTAETELSNTLLSSSAQIATDISGAFTSTSASLASNIASNSINTFKSTGQRNGSSGITGSLHLTGSTSDLRVDGTIGIGTAAPTTTNVMMHIKSHLPPASAQSPTVIIEGGDGGDNASIQLKNGDVNWELQTIGGGYSDSFLIRDTSTTNYPFAIDPSAAGNASHPLLYLENNKVSILGHINANPDANLLVSGNLFISGPNGHITASGNISSSALIEGIGFRASGNSAFGGQLHVGGTTTTSFNTGQIFKATGTSEFTGDITGSSKLLIQKSSGEGTPTAGTSDVAIFQNNTSGQDASIAIIAADEKRSQLHFGRYDAIDAGSIRYFHSSSETLPNTLQFRIDSTPNVIGFAKDSGNRGMIGVGIAGRRPNDFFHAQGALSGGGLTISSSNGTKILIDRGASSSLGIIQFNTSTKTDWSLGNINGENNNNFYIYNGSSNTKFVEFVSASNSTHIYTNITASNNISASGNVIASEFYGDGSNLTNLPAASVPAGTISSSQHIFTALTSSGNISASGTVTAATGIFGTSTTTINDNINTTGNITASGNISSSGTLLTNKGVFGTDDTEKSRVIITSTGHITASGNVSASGFMSASAFVGDGSGLTGIVAAAPSGTISSSLHVFSSITSSGNISSSKNIIGNVLELSSGGTLIDEEGITTSLSIIAVGNITSSGVIKTTKDVEGNTANFNLVRGTTGSFSHMIGGSPLTFGGDDVFQFESDINLGITASGGDAKILNANDVEIIEPLLQGTFTTGVQGSGRTKFGGAHEVELYSQGATKIYSVKSGGNQIGSYMLMGSGSLPGGNNVANTDTNTIRFGFSGSSHPTLGDFYGGTDSIVFNTPAGHITASGNISASGDILGNTLIANNIIFYSGSTSIKVEVPDEVSNTIGAPLTLEAGSGFGPNFAGGDLILNAGKGSGGGVGGDVTINTFGVVSGGSAASSGSFIVNSKNFTLTSGGNVTATSLNTGQGDYELYNMNQNVTTTSNVTFNNVTASLNLKVNGDTLLGNHESDTHTFNGHITASGNISASHASTASFGSMKLTNLPTTKPTTTGSLWLSGSAGQGSKFLVVFTG